MSSPPVALKCENVTRSFDNSARGVFDVDLAVTNGSVYALLGGNGAGKTTLINLCLGFLQPDKGRVLVAGLDMAQRGTLARRRLAYVPEVARLYGHFNAVENVRFFEELNGRRLSDADVELALGRLSFPEGAIRKPARTYSKGMRQKVVIAMGLAKGADVFFLDEPTSGLDPVSGRQFIRIIDSLRADSRTVIISTHEIHNICEYADRIGVMKDGRLMRESATSGLTIQALERMLEDS